MVSSNRPIDPPLRLVGFDRAGRGPLAEAVFNVAATFSHQNATWMGTEREGGAAREIRRAEPKQSLRRWLRSTGLP